jgi:hypothetical protein
LIDMCVSSLESETYDNRRSHPLHATSVNSSYEPEARTVTLKSARYFSTA